MKVGIMIQSNQPEKVWNAFRFGIVSLQAGHEVSVFLMSEGVEAIEINHEKFDVQNKIPELEKLGGKVLACGTCIKSRHQKESAVCSINTMKDFLKLVEESDKIITF